MTQEPTPLACPDDALAEASFTDSYDPADYRWVPVRRRPRLDGWTEEKQRRFIEALADTGLVSHAAKEVGMSRESANRLRRSPHGAAFSQAWDAARHHAGAGLEDIAFERAIEGVEHNVFNEYGEVVCTKRVYNDRLLTFLLRHLKPERYARDALSLSNLASHNLAAPAPPAELLDASLRAMEPQLPAPAETLLGADVLEDELILADVMDGALPHFLTEQRAPKSAARALADEIAAQEARGEAALERIINKKDGDNIEVSRQDMIDITRTLDPTSRNEQTRGRFR